MTQNLSVAIARRRFGHKPRKRFAVGDISRSERIDGALGIVITAKPEIGIGFDEEHIGKPRFGKDRRAKRVGKGERAIVSLGKDFRPCLFEDCRAQTVAANADIAVEDRRRIVGVIFGGNPRQSQPSGIL